MQYKLKDGSILTEEDIERLAAAAENGNYPGEPGTWIVRPKGRPRLNEYEDLETITFKLTRSQKEALDKKAASLGESRSAYIRNVIEQALTQ